MILPLSNKMPYIWYYDKKDLKNTPSVRDGLDFETDRRYRKEGARFIMQCGTAMGLGHNTMATGVVYFHRFYMFHSFKSFPRYVTACCCLFLAGKVEETPKKCKDIIKTARSMLSDQKFQSFGEDPKEEVMTLERILLQTIKFDLQVEHPYSFLVKYAKCLKGDQTKLQKMVQMAWNFVNDSLSTTVCLQWEPEIIAVALIHLASKLSKFEVIDWIGRQALHLRWWDMFVADVTMEILEDICHQVLDLYQQQNPQLGIESPPQTPTSKSSPTAKRAKSSPSYNKSSPLNNPPKPPIDDKIPETNEPHQMPKQILLPSDGHYSTYPPAYGTMFPSHMQQQQQQQYGVPPNIIPPRQPISAQVYGTHQYAPQPSQVVAHYPTVGPPPTNYYQQPPPAAGRGGYY